MSIESIDAIYVTASRNDARFTRICVASIRYFYPDAPIRLLIGGPLEPGLEAELARYWNVLPANVQRRDWGWGFVKLEPLFGPPGERFMVVDSDTAFAGPVLSTWAERDAPFLVDDEQQSEADTHRLYYDWTRVAAIDPAARPPAFVFNTGQWFGTAGIVDREHFARWIDWSGACPSLRHPKLFMPGDQGVLNYVLNQQAATGALHVARRKIMHWPGFGMPGLGAETIAGRQAPPVVIHWAGMKRARLDAMPGADVLHFFEASYYRRWPAGAARRHWAAVRHTVRPVRHRLANRLRRPVRTKT